MSRACLGKPSDFRCRNGSKKRGILLLQVNNTLDKYTAHCNPCLYNVGNTSLGDWTEHEDLAAAHPSIVTAMTSRLEDLRSTMHENCHRRFLLFS